MDGHVGPLCRSPGQAGPFSSCIRRGIFLAFVSSASANGLLSDAWSRGISSTELVLANLFNSFSAYLVHLPSLFLLIWPVLGFPAAIYVGLSLLAALGRTIPDTHFWSFYITGESWLCG